MTLPTKNSTAYSNVSKDATAMSLFMRHGKSPTMEELADYTFQSVVFADGSVMKDLTFAQLADIVWSNIPKS